MEPDLHLKSYSEQYPRNCQQIDFSPNIVLVEATKASVNEKSPTTAGGKMDAFFYDTKRVLRASFWWIFYLVPIVRVLCAIYIGSYRKKLLIFHPC